MKTTPEETITRGSGNVFTDIGVAHPEEALAKAELVRAIADVLNAKNVSQAEAAKLVRLTQPQVSRLLRGDVREFSYERLMRVLNALGRDVHIIVREASNPRKPGKVVVGR